MADKNAEQFILMVIIDCRGKITFYSIAWTELLKSIYNSPKRIKSNRKNSDNDKSVQRRVVAIANGKQSHITNEIHWMFAFQHSAEQITKWIFHLVISCHWSNVLEVIYFAKKLNPNFRRNFLNYWKQNIIFFLHRFIW